MIMEQDQILHMIVGRFQSPNHSKNREKDDSHEIKKQVLKEIRRLCKEKRKRDYSKEIGDNPDIETENGLIILKGRGKFKNKPYYRTSISAASYFGLQLISTSNVGQFEVSIILFDLSKNEIFIEYDQIFILPKDEQIIELTFDRLFEDYLKSEKARRSIILVTR